jgi:hypothetical protein
MQLGLRSEKTRDFAEDERILSLIENLVKSGIAIYSAKLTSKMPHTDIVCHWHQDEAYPDRSNPPSIYCILSGSIGSHWEQRSVENSTSGVDNL